MIIQANEQRSIETAAYSQARRAEQGSVTIAIYVSVGLNVLWQLTSSLDHLDKITPFAFVPPNRRESDSPPCHQVDCIPPTTP